MMSSIFLYLSEAKIRQLSEQKPSLFSNVTAKFGLKLPFVSGEMTRKKELRLVPELERLLPMLRRKHEMPMFSNIDRNNIPVFFAFEGPAVHTIDHNQFWLAMEADRSALLLSGSVNHALGDNVNSNSESISPSADPVGSFNRASQEKEGNLDSSLCTNLSYVWQHVMKSSIESEVVLPHVEGIAVFGATLKAVKGQMRRVNRAFIESIVIGTPLYVKQKSA